ncbi:2-dehydro-3-deoxygalactonokinase, partial [Streptomyces rochei]|uniref:2-dehydro-3-deoxygalactonokinase n=1 Tax=Streptomyces rochei TaxID=1928 RepID=UPI0036C9A2F0
MPRRAARRSPPPVPHLVPGLRIPSGENPGDVIRGEETQLVGALDTLGHPGGPLTL